MYLIWLKAEHRQDEAFGIRRWLDVEEESLLAAMVCFPDSDTVKAVSIQLAAASGPGRITAWVGSPPRGLKQTPRNSGRATHLASHSRRRRAQAHQTSGWLAQTGL
jgi:hypothetical protein